MTDNITLQRSTRLHSIGYTEFEEDAARAWQLERFELAHINLIVGLNASGKSRVLRLINGLARSVEGAVQPANLETGSYVAIFNMHEGSEKIKYEFAISHRKVTTEKLTVNSEIRLNRKPGGRAELWFDKNRTMIDVQIPEIHLAASARRDPDQHPFFEPLHNWAASVKYFESTKVALDNISVFGGKITSDMTRSVPFAENLHLFFKLAKERHPTDFTSAILRDMRRLNYQLESVDLKPTESVPAIMSKGAAQTLFVREKGVGVDISQNAMSSGMLRALATLVCLHSSRLAKQRDCLLIDDIGEGLDFDRSTKLIEILKQEAEKGFLQLVMTTNDRFVMNSLPISYWSVIQREGGMVEVFNKENSSEMFSDFERWGFNNFDFFSKKLYARKLAVQSK